MRNKDYKKQGEMHPDFPESEEDWNKQERIKIVKNAFKEADELDFLNKLKERLKGYHCGYHKELNKMIENRMKELRG
jgi:hypothetical protein